MNPLMQAAAKQEEEKKYYVFYSRIPNSTVYFPDGSVATFPGGKFATDDEGKAAFLLQEIKRGNMYLHIDPLKFEVTAAELDPQAEYEARIIAKYLESQKAKENADVGSSEQGKLNTVTTANVGAAAVGSASGAQGLVLRNPLASAPTE